MAQKFKSKFDKRIHDNEKRKESLKRKLNEKLNYKEVIKNALSNSSAAKSRKIVFDDSIVNESEKDEEKLNENYNLTSSDGAEDKLNLFGESDDDDVNYEIEIKKKFEGKKGHKLLNLQSNYNNDDRFKLDERFYDDDDEDDNGGGDSHEEEDDAERCENSGSNELEKEKESQLKILGDVLGHPIETKQKKSKNSFVEMVRFDASNEDHRRPDAPKEIVDEAKVVKKKKLSREERKEKKKKKMEAVENEPKVNPTSEEKFYRVSDGLKVALESGKTQNSQFSLLSAFSRTDVAEEPSEPEPEPESDMGDSADAGEREEVTVPELEEEKAEVTKVQGIKKERFFFAKGDPRFQEGLSFINMKNSEEAKRAQENYENTRRDIREVLRLRWQKHRQRNNPFKKKIGGSFKKNGQFNRSRNSSGKSKRSR